MKKPVLIVMLIGFSCSLFSQSFFIKEGRNYTKFYFQNPQSVVLDIHPYVGNSYEVGCTFPIEDAPRFHYELGLQFDEFNTYVEAPISLATYNAHYLGINNSLLFSIIDSNRDFDRFSLDIKTGINLKKLVDGKEDILGKTYDLNQFEEFNGVFISFLMGLESKFVINDYVDLSLGYERCMSFLNTKDSNFQSLSFQSNQFKIGVHFQLN